MYQAKGHDNGLECSDEIRCMNCDSSKGCYPQPSFDIYNISGWGTIRGEEELLQHLQNGPVTVSICANDLLDAFNGGYIFNVSSCTEANHAVELIGYGVENGVKYWTIRNSWGTYWGERGNAKILRGEDVIGIESQSAYWATPIAQPLKVVRKQFLETKEKAEFKGCKIEETSFKNGERIT